MKHLMPDKGQEKMVIMLREEGGIAGSCANNGTHHSVYKNCTDMHSMTPTNNIEEKNAGRDGECW